MNARSAAALMIAALAGCAGSVAPDAASDADAASDIAPRDPIPTDACVARAPNHPSSHGHEYLFVIDTTQLENDSAPEVTGFDLDGLYSNVDDALGCQHPDFFTRYHDQRNCPEVDRDGRCIAAPDLDCTPDAGSCQGGVDNQLVALASTVCQSCDYYPDTLQRAVATSRYVQLFRLTNVDDDTEDPSVDVYTYRGFPTFTSGCDQVLPGRAYAIDRASLLPGAQSLDDGAFHAVGAIHRGRLYVATCGEAIDTTIFGPSSWPVAGPFPSRGVHALHLAADVSARQLARGAVGGYIPADDIIAAVRELAPDYVNVVRGVIGGLVDIPLNGICVDQTGPEPRYGAMSIGFGFHAVPAVISTATPFADAPTAGTCGWSPQAVDAGGRG